MQQAIPANPMLWTHHATTRLRGRSAFPESHVTHTNFDWFRWLVESSTAHRKVKLRVAGDINEN